MTESTVNIETTTEETTAPSTGAEPRSSAIESLMGEAGSEQSALLVGYYSYLDEISAERDLPDAPYREHLAPEVRANLLHQSKLERANARREEVKAEYAQMIGKAHRKIAERKEALRAELYDIDPDMLVRVTTATDDQIRLLANAATQAGKKSGEPIAKALLLASQQRDIGEVGASILRAFPHLEPKLREWQSLPTDEILERQSDPATIEQIVPKPAPERLRARPQIR